MDVLAEITYLQEELEYPDSDGKPVAESDFQFTPLLYAVDALRAYFRARPDVYVAGDLLLYYEQGNRGAVIAPDVFVVFGAEKRRRPSYLLWREGKAPNFVLEITSKSTVREDQITKRRTYAALGVQEYFQFDPTADYLSPPLQGLRLVRDQYVALPLEELSDGKLVMRSDILGLELHTLPNGEFRFVDPETGEVLVSHEESLTEREAARAQVRQEAALRVAAEERAAAAEARLAELEKKMKG